MRQRRLQILFLTELHLGPCRFLLTETDHSAADRQTTGGYGKIATVASVDIPRWSREKTDHKIRFQAISVQEAQALYLKEIERTGCHEKDHSSALQRGSGLPTGCKKTEEIIRIKFCTGQCCETAVLPSGINRKCSRKGDTNGFRKD